MKVFPITKYRHFYLLAVVMILTSLACSLPQAIFRPDPTPLPVSAEAVTEMKDNLDEAAKALQETGEVNFQITEVQITSYLVNELNTQENPFIDNPQILLRNGEIQLTADYQQGELAVPLKAALSIEADGSGKLMYELTSASIGPLALPEALVGQMLGQFQQMFDNNISSQLDQVYIESVLIEDGTMTIQGHSQ
jgi:uncharacterized protein YpmS